MMPHDSERSTGFWEAQLEVRQEGSGPPELAGAFPYNDTAVIADRGRVRKERFAPGAFRHSILAATAQEAIGGGIQQGLADISLLYGHNFSRPIAGVRAGSLQLRDTRAGVEFVATLPVETQQPSWVRDALLAVRAGLIGGISPGFRVPPAAAVANATDLVPERGNPDVMIRLIRAAILYELSLVTRPAYRGSAINLRAEGLQPDDQAHFWALGGVAWR